MFDHDVEDMLAPATALWKPPGRERAPSRADVSDTGSSGLGDGIMGKGARSSR